MNNVLNEISKYIKTETGDLNLIGKLIFALIIFFTAVVLTKIISALISKKIYSSTIEKRDSTNRILTLMQLVRKIINVFIYFIAITFMLQIFGIKTNSLLATVGVGSLAISFGAQNLVKDVINGFFIIIEDHYAVGDLVKISNFEGYIEEVGLKSTKLRDFNGSLHIIPNGQIGIITNEQRGLMRAKVQVQIDISEDPDRIIGLIDEGIKSLNDDVRVKKGPEIWGVTDNSDRSYTVTAAVYSLLQDKYDLEYEMRKRIIKILNDNKVKLPHMRGEIREV